MGHFLDYECCRRAQVLGGIRKEAEQVSGAAASFGIPVSTPAGVSVLTSSVVHLDWVS